VSLELTSLWHRETAIRGCYAYTTPTSTPPSTSFATTTWLAWSRPPIPCTDYTDAIAHAAAAGRRGAVKVAFDLRGS
jgi:hypothetical protein